MRTIAYVLSLAFIFVIPWEDVELFGFGAIAPLIGFAMAVAWGAAVLGSGGIRRPGAFHIAVGLFVLWNAASVAWSSNPADTLAHAFTWAQLAILVIALWDLYTTRTAVTTGLQMYVLGAYVAIGAAAVNYIAGRSFYAYGQRFSAGDTNPDGFSFIVALGIPVAWYLAGANGLPRLNGLLKLVNYAYIPASFFALALAGTRTALIAAIAGCAYGLLSLGRVKPWARVAIAALLVAAVLAVVPYVEGLKSFQRLGTTVTELTEGDLNNRTNNWSEGLWAFAQRPLLGVGSDMYRSVNSLGKVAHNSFISVLVELGLVGFALFGVILLITVTRAYVQPKWDAMFWLAVLAVWMIGASTLTWEYRKTTWLFFGLLVSHSAVIAAQRERPSATLPLPDRRAS